MAQALQCPACGHRHRVRAVPAGITFRCRGCGRALRAPAAGAAEGTAGRGRSPTRAPPPGAARRARRVVGAWALGVPLGGLVVLALANWTGFVTGSRLIDIMTGTGWVRYWRLAALVPPWALITALLVTVMLGRPARAPRRARAPIPAGTDRMVGGGGPRRVPTRAAPPEARPAAPPPRRPPPAGAEAPRRRIPLRHEVEGGDAGGERPRRTV